MYIHISMFRFRDRKQLPQVREQLRKRLLEFPEHIPTIRDYRLEDNCLGQPAVPEGSPLTFCDLIQIAAFDSSEALEAYPKDPCHQAMVRETDHLLERVCILDYEVEMPQG